MRKSVKIVDLLDYANSVMRHSTNGGDREDGERMRGYRRGVATMIEHALMECDAYAGYGYLTREQVPNGCEPGIERREGRVADFPDPTRRVYYLHPRLR